MDAITAALNIGGKLIDRVFPDPVQAAVAQRELLKLAQDGELAHLAAETELAKAQVEVNKAEAAAPDLFTRGWRPFIGWICGVGLGTQFLVGPFATWISGLLGSAVVFPDLDMGTLLTLLGGMLGLGGLRTLEKVKGRA